MNVTFPFVVKILSLSVSSDSSSHCCNPTDSSLNILSSSYLLSVFSLKSKHDDGIDTVSMLAAMSVFLPDAENPVQYQEDTGLFAIPTSNVDISPLATYTV